MNVPEVWKPVPGYEGLYEISNMGNVKSLARMKPYRDGFRRFPGGILKPNKINGGYRLVMLTNSHTRKGFLVHRLVAESFIENPNCLPQVNHIDGNKENNTVSNLEWCTAKENMLHSVKNRLRSDLKPVVMLTKDGRVVRKFNGVREAARETGIERTNIRFCCNNKHRSAGGYLWRWSV